MIYRLMFIFLLFTVAHDLVGQTDFITVRIEKVGSHGDLEEFSFLPNGQFIRFTRSRPQSRSQAIHEIAYPKGSSTIIAESWSIVGEAGPGGVHLTKQTVRVQDSLIERTVRTVGNTLYREAVYILDGNGRPVQLKITQEKIEGESRSYQVRLFDYVWNGTTEVVIKPQKTREAHYSVKKKKHSTIIDKKIKRERNVRTRVNYKKDGKLNSVTYMGAPSNELRFVRRKDGSLQGAFSSPFPITDIGNIGKYIWTIKKQDYLAVLSETVNERINKAILEELVLKDLDYRLFFPEELGLF